jgi:ribonuclease HI
MQTNTNTKMDSYILYFDGCSKGNPGPSGAGAVLYKNDVIIWKGCQFVGMEQTNNQAEYYGLILGLTKAKQLGITNITILGDSQLVIKQMKKEYDVKSQSILPLYQKAADLASHFSPIFFEHIYRKENKIADSLANQALEIIDECQNELEENIEWTKEEEF